jgi:hypothetical protein
MKKQKRKKWYLINKLAWKFLQKNLLNLFLSAKFALLNKEYQRNGQLTVNSKAVYYSPSIGSRRKSKAFSFQLAFFTIHRQLAPFLLPHRLTGSKVIFFSVKRS